MTHVGAKPGKGTLFHTKDGDLDLGYLFLTPFLLLGCVAFTLAACGIWRVTVAMWSWLGSLIASLLICAVPIARARLLAKATLPGDVGGAIASAPAELLARRKSGEYEETL